MIHISPVQNHNIEIGEPSFATQKEGTLVKIPIEATYNVKEGKNFRAHLLVSNFVVPDFVNQFSIENIESKGKAGETYFSFNKSVYFNNKNLSEESSYVLNRRNEKKYIGNNLEKPKLFLKRTEVRDTTEKDETLNSGNDYSRGRNQL